MDGPPSKKFFAWLLLLEGPSLQVDILSVYLYVRHHFYISNLGPSNHTRSMSDPTYLTSLERGWHQRWQWQWQRCTQWWLQRQRQKLKRPNTWCIFKKQGLDTKYDSYSDSQNHQTHQNHQDHQRFTKITKFTTLNRIAGINKITKITRFTRITRFTIFARMIRFWTDKKGSSVLPIYSEFFMRI